MLDGREAAKLDGHRPLVVERGRTAHHDALEPWPLSRRAANHLSQLRFRVTRDGAAVEHRGVSVVDGVDDRMAARLDHRANGFRVIVVGATPEGAQVDVHAGTAPPAVTRTSLWIGLVGNEK